MMRLALLLAFWAVALTALAIGVDVVSRIWRRRDAVLWHAIWRGFILAACAGITTTALTPMSIVIATDVLPPAATFTAAGASSAAGTVAVSAIAAIIAITAVLLLRLLAGWLRVHRIARLAWPVSGLDLRAFQSSAT
ncbi:MAG TPA: hypothetical protein VFO19_22675, partial [Vicinamibacterales bacterium]|nr:hypothetical protein [Vicinamibacterales bacterium]